MEQEEYTKEEINWSYVEFVDNQDVLDLIEKVLPYISHFLRVNFSSMISCLDSILPYNFSSWQITIFFTWNLMENSWLCVN